ncbi:MAG: hypothetical protein JXR64_10190 [Spirochaetales bacterium]|nr:hypothetical protein [Spirochaetales bacterium]
MVQIYLLVILCNLFVGLILTKDFFNSKFENFTLMNQLLSSEIMQVTVGCISTIVGLLALFLRYTGNLIVLGDLIPALSAIIAGMTLFVEYIAQEENNDSSFIKFFKKTFLKNRVIIGFISITVGIIHFVAPSIELL